MRWWNWLLGVVLLLIAVAGTVLVALQSDWFREKVRQRIISEMEESTGGRVDIGTFRYNWRTLTAEVSPFILHGKEKGGAPPLLYAERIQIGLKILSVLKRDVDVEEIIVERPQGHITVAVDGTSNFPVPKVARKGDTLQQLIDLSVKHFEVRNGFIDYNEARVPVDLSATDLAADIRYSIIGPQYAGTVTAREVKADDPDLAGPLAVSVKARLALRKDKLEVVSAEITRGKSRVQLAGAITGFSAPKGDFTINSHLLSQDFGAAVSLPGRGEADYQGKAWFRTFPFSFGLSGDAKGRTGAIALASNIEVDEHRLILPHAQISAYGGTFTGRVSLMDWKKLSVAGEARKFPVDQLVKLAGQKLEGLSGTVSGPVKASALLTRRSVQNLLVEAKVELTPGVTGVPLSGNLDVKYDQSAAKISLNPSQLTLGTTQVWASGVVGERIDARLESHDLNDILTALHLAGQEVTVPLPVQLDGGIARFEGTVTGPVADSQIDGNVQVTSFRYAGQTFDRFAAQVHANSALIALKSFSLDQGSLHAQGPAATLGLVNWRARDASALTATVTATDIDLAKYVANKVPVSVVVSGSITVKGTLGDPEGSGEVKSDNVVFYSEKISRTFLRLNYGHHTLNVTDGEMDGAGGRLTFSGSYSHDASDWQTGQIRFTLNATGLGLARLQNVQDIHQGITGQTGGKASGTAKMTKGVFDLVSLEAEGSIRDIVIDNHPYGSVALKANTHDSTLQVEARADLRGTQLTGKGGWQLTGDYPGSAQIEIPRLTAATLHDLSPGEHVREKLPFEGYLQGKIRIDGPLKKPDSLVARATFDTVQLNADPAATPLAGAQAKDLVIKNSKPVVLRATTKVIEIESAEFAAKDTTLSATGRFALDSKTAWDLKLTGNVNLTILQLFNPDLLGTGNSVINATVRGTIEQPDVNGRLELKNASLFLKDVPNGIDEANGVILFDRSRATIQSLSATTGGGKVIFQAGSFLGFRGSVVTYRLLAEAQDVRYRSPDGLSITVGANLSLVGTSESSVLSGTVTVLKAGLSARTDLGSLLAATARPISTPSSPNEYLRGLQFDVRLVSAQSLQLQTSLTRDVQADANLRIRGNSQKPVVLGNITVNSGEIDFFGNQYSITRGEVNFFNPVKIEPILDMDLETKVRGITVEIRFSGPLTKLNFSYRSDPPFEPSQIIALLAVGRVPTAIGGLASSQTGTSANFLATGSNALVSQAISPTTGRLERFFGVSHIKIDPQFTDVTAIPQARLTLEQQISKEVTLTYLTNLTRAQEQLIRVEWDLSRQWAVVALRDESGSFGVDFQYKKRFK